MHLHHYLPFLLRSVPSFLFLYGDCRHGRRPSFTEAENPESANLLYEKVVTLCRETGLHIITGCFQTHMNIILDNDGPVTMIIDSNKQF